MGPESWSRRHRSLLIILWGHALVLPLFGWMQGFDGDHLAIEALVLPLIGFAAMLPILPTRARSGLVALGLISSSALLTHFSGGYIEAHFHFFVMVGLIALYQDWVPFLLAIGFVAIHHGVVGTIDPGSVYNHPAALGSPWLWAGIHAFFVLAMSAACIVTWAANERTQAQLHSREAQLTNAQRLARLGSWAWDRRTGRVEASDAFFRILGLRGENGSVEGQVVGNVLHPDDRPRAQQAAAASLATGGPFEIECRIMHGRETRWILSRGACERDEAGVPFGIAGTIMDITERHEAEEERLKRLEQRREIDRLTELDQFKTDFLNHAAHEMGTPLTPIRVQLHLLKQKARPEDQAAFEMVERNFVRITGLTRDLLDAARAQAGRLDPAIEEVPLRRLVEDAVSSMHAAATQAGIRLDLFVDEDCIVRADPKRVSQVLYNLLSNAVKFTPRGGQASVQIRSAADFAEIEVRDTGAGFDQAQAERLFQPFSRVHEASFRDVPGTGLGLFICQGIVHAHGGKIWCQSDGPGKGARFVFSLPTASKKLPEVRAGSIGVAA